VIGDAGQHVGEVVLRVATVELGGLDQGVDRRGAVAAGVGTGEQIVLAADRDTAPHPNSAIPMARSVTSKKAASPAAGAGQPAKLRQKDRDARWTVKYTKAKPSADGAPRVDLAVPAFGYKNHVGIDRRHRLIRRWTVTDAARYDGVLLPELIDTNNTAGGVWADTAYRSQANEKFLAGRVLRSQIHRKKPKSLPRRGPGANQCRAAPPAPMPASRQCVRRSNMSSPVRRGQ
jgi:hypothetical protein